MTFTSTTTSHLQQACKQIDYTFELRTNFAASSEWQAYAFEDFTLTQDAHAPSSLRVELINANLDFSNERSVNVRSQLLAEARLTATIGTESEVLFSGRVQRIEPRDCRFGIVCQDWMALLNECECTVNLAPAETAEISPARQLVLVAGGAYGSVFGFACDGSGTDPAFNAGLDAGSRRRTWVPADIRLFQDAAATQEVAPQHYQVNLTGGTVTILEETAGQSYYATGVRCFVEGTLDWAEVFAAALTCPVSAGGAGLTGEQLDLPETGLDVAGPVFFQGRVIDLVSQILQRQQANLRLWYDSRQGRFKLRVITQKARDEEDWELSAAQSISQPRDLRELYSRIVVIGRTERPQNALTLSVTTISDQTSQGDWFSWDGLNVGTDSTFATVVPLLSDGDANLGAAVHNLAEAENGGSDQYDSWYDFIRVDLGSLQRLHRLRVTLPGSRNINAAAGHQGLFWPGVKLLGSTDGSDWRLLSTGICGRYQPLSQVEAEGTDLLYPGVRYIQVQLGAYKHGFENHDDPSIGLAELEVYTTEEYRVSKSIDGTEPAALYQYTDGSVWSRYHPALWTRLGERYRTRIVDRSNELNEYLAHDHALDLLAESVRLFQQVKYTAVCDPRPGLYDTVKVRDAMNGDVGGLLVERVVLKPQGTEVWGTDYCADVLG